VHEFYLHEHKRSIIRTAAAGNAAAAPPPPPELIYADRWVKNGYEFQSASVMRHLVILL